MFRNRQKSASNAKDRLKVVLIHDRSELPAGVMDDLKRDLIEVISRHVDVDRDSVHIEFAQEGRDSRLIADIPLQKSKRKQNR